MAQNDLFRVICHLSVKNRRASFGLWYREKVDSDETLSAQMLARAWEAAHVVTLRECLSVETQVESVSAYRRFPGPTIPGRQFVDTGFGLDGPGLAPANNAVVLRIVQFEQNARFNGRIYLTGATTNRLSINRWADDYLSTKVDVFATGLKLDVSAQPGDIGQWELGVVSAAFTPSLPPGLFIKASDVQSQKIVYSQRRRNAKAEGPIDATDQ